MRSILILDDDYELAVAWRKRLREAGFDVEIGLNSTEALALANSRDFDMYIVAPTRRALNDTACKRAFRYPRGDDLFGR